MPVADAGGGGAESGWVYPAPGWVCSECGFDYDACAPPTTPETLRGFGRRYRIPLVRGLPGEDLDGLLRMRRDPQTWSALEYACHTRDGFALYEHRIGVVLVEDRPMLSRMRRDEVVVERNYNSQNPPTSPKNSRSPPRRLQRASRVCLLRLGCAWGCATTLR
jgi:hypothetical protein